MVEEIRLTEMSTTDVQFTVPTKLATTWLKVCRFVHIYQKFYRSCSIELISYEFEIKLNSVYAGIRRYDCLELVDTGQVAHHPRHKITEELEESGHLEGGYTLLSGHVQNSELASYLSNFFDLSLEFGYHGAVWRSPADHAVVATELQHRKTYPGPKCNYLIELANGGIAVILRSKYRGHKYNLEYRDHLELRMEITKKLEQLIGFNPWPQLYLESVDLAQDMIITSIGKADLAHHRIQIEDLYYVQEYPIIKEGKKYLRREFGTLRKAATKDLGIMQELLSKKAGEIQQTKEYRRMLKGLIARSNTLEEFAVQFGEMLNLCLNQQADIYKNWTDTRQDMSDALSAIVAEMQLQRKTHEHLIAAIDRMTDQNNELLMELTKAKKEPRWKFWK